MRLLTLAVTFLFVACAPPRSGDGCNGTADCGKNLSCVICNTPNDAGMDTSPGTCEHTCQSDADCAGTSSVFGPTPKCGKNLCDVHFCTIDI